jgi:predicted transposase YbfD/YdcC
MNTFKESTILTETTTPTISFMADFASLRDPRKTHLIDHLLIDIVTIAILGTICGANDFPGIAEFGRDNEAWLRTFLTLPHGIPAHDTFGRVFARIRPAEFHRCFQSWIARVVQLTGGEVVPVDGKVLRRSHDKTNGVRALTCVSAWATGNRLSLGQYKVAADSNEITAVPQLLRLLSLQGCIVTVDAMHTQKDTVAEIVRQEADYVCPVKDNQATLATAVADLFEAVQAERTANIPCDTYQTVDGDHGRIETRRYWSIPAVDFLPGFADWPKLTSLGMIEATREVPGKEPTVSVRYYLSSLAPSAKELARVTRAHWRIENSCHWILDVAFREDDSRVRTGHAAENLSLVRRLTLNMLQQETTVKLGIQNKRLKAARNREYLLKVVNASVSTAT